MANKCKDCGCTCKRCISSDHDVQLHLEIENLKQRLLERENHIVTMETNFLNEANKFPSGELVAAREELLTWQDKYKRLYEAHRRVQRVNQGLEDKLLKLVDVCETEKNTLTKDVATLSHKLAEANYAIKKLTEDNERYKNDVTLAIQFLQCKQSNFVAHKFDSLSPEVQNQVANYMTHKKKPEERKTAPEVKSIKVPIPTFPPTAMVYSVPKSPKPERKEETDIEAPTVDIVSAAIMAKVLEERQKERALAKHCDTCTCAKDLKIIYDRIYHSVGTQTGEYKEMLCLKCNDNIQATSTAMKIVKNGDGKSHKLLSVYPLENVESGMTSQTLNNIVKVQPNNFLIDNKSKTDSDNSSSIDLYKIAFNQNFSPKSNIINPNNHVISNEIRMYQDVTFSKINENPNVNSNSEYHQLRSRPSLGYDIEVNSYQTDSEKNIDQVNAKNNSSEDLKGPRYCSMRMQTGTKNILLDNAHNNIAPVLYTRNYKYKHEKTVQAYNSSITDILPSSECQIATDNSIHNQQRVAEWIQNNLDNDLNSSDNSRTDSLINNQSSTVDKDKYAEMEENVKRFLFGESEFLKTVEIGKLKYQNLKEESGSSREHIYRESRKNSHTETDI